MGFTLSSDGTEVLKNLLDAACSEPCGIPGAAVVVVNKEGKEVFAHASGKRGLDDPEPMAVDSIFWIASCTKLITGIAIMQLVEKGKLVLDDAAALEKILPELAAVKVLRDDNTLESKKKGITLRMLMNHTGICPFCHLSTPDYCTGR
jgi:CubicO group peptidase (beta-lactamase class C family)